MSQTFVAVLAWLYIIAIREHCLTKGGLPHTPGPTVLFTVARDATTGIISTTLIFPYSVASVNPYKVISWYFRLVV